MVRSWSNPQNPASTRSSGSQNPKMGLRSFARDSRSAFDSWRAVAGVDLLDVDAVFVKAATGATAPRARERAAMVFILVLVLVSLESMGGAKGFARGGC